MAASMDGPYTGRVKSFNRNKMWGFMECEESHAIYGKDILLPGSSVGDHPPDVGAVCTFYVTDGKNGPIAVELSQEASQLPAKEGLDGPYIGHVKSWNNLKKWGFLECAESQAVYGKDILLPWSSLGAPPEVGGSYTFYVADGKTGPIAVELKPQYMAGKGAAKGKGKDNGRKRPFSAIGGVPSDLFGAKRGRLGGLVPVSLPVSAFLAGHAQPRPAIKPGKRYSGVVKSFSALKGWGFITSDQILRDFGKDLMVRKEELPNHHAESGEAVSCTVGQGRTGPVATDVRKVNAGLDVDASNMRLEGIVKSWNATKGWGFITSDDILNMFGKDIMVRKDALPDGHVETGQRLSFLAAEGRTGPIATQVQLL